MWYLHMKSPITKDNILFYSIYIPCPEQANPERKYVSGCLGLGKSGKRVWVLTIKMLYDWPWRRLLKSMDILNTTERHTLHGWITWLMNYMSVKLIRIFVNNKHRSSHALCKTCSNSHLS